MVTNLKDVSTQDVMRDITVHDTEYLKTLFVVIPKGIEEDFMASIEKVGSDIFGFGGPDWSHNPRELGRAVQYGSSVDCHVEGGSLSILEWRMMKKCQALTDSI